MALDLRDFSNVLGALLALAASQALAQDAPYPKRGNIEMTVLFPAGTSADVTARLGSRP